jgi:hypothetical protein
MTGRLRVGREGFNATLTGSREAVRSFTDELRVSADSNYVWLAYFICSEHLPAQWTYNGPHEHLPAKWTYIRNLFVSMLKFPSLRAPLILSQSLFACAECTVLLSFL